MTGLVWKPLQEILQRPVGHPWPCICGLCFDAWRDYQATLCADNHRGPIKAGTCMACMQRVKLSVPA